MILALVVIGAAIAYFALGIGLVWLLIRLFELEASLHEDELAEAEIGAAVLLWPLTLVLAVVGLLLTVAGTVTSGLGKTVLNKKRKEA